MRDNKGNRFSVEDGTIIQAKLECRCNVRLIALSLRRSPATISCELRRCGWKGQSTSPSKLRTRGIDVCWFKVA